MTADRTRRHVRSRSAAGETCCRDFILPPPPLASIAVRNATARFPVRRIICVGRNYAAHAREMGRDPDLEPPFFFMKPADTVMDNGTTVPYPAQTNNFHHEIELIVAIGQGGIDIPVERALDYVWGYGVGIDLTRRDLQLQAREQRRPWTGTTVSIFRRRLPHSVRPRRSGIPRPAASGSRSTMSSNRIPTSQS